jgi:hypothetical protein
MAETKLTVARKTLIEIGGRAGGADPRTVERVLRGETLRSQPLQRAIEKELKRLGLGPAVEANRAEASPEQAEASTQDAEPDADLQGGR